MPSPTPNINSLVFRQGCYSQEGDIVVLCAYLGQLAKVRDALSNSEVAVVIDERDQVALDERTRDDDEDDDGKDTFLNVERVPVSKRVKLDLLLGQNIYQRVF